MRRRRGGVPLQRPHRFRPVDDGGAEQLRPSVPPARPGDGAGAAQPGGGGCRCWAWTGRSLRRGPGHRRTAADLRGVAAWRRAVGLPVGRPSAIRSRPCWCRRSARWPPSSPSRLQARTVLSAIGSGERTFTNIARAAGGIGATPLSDRWDPHGQAGDRGGAARVHAPLEGPSLPGRRSRRRRVRAWRSDFRDRAGEQRGRLLAAGGDVGVDQHDQGRLEGGEVDGHGLVARDGAVVPDPAAGLEDAEAVGEAGESGRQRLQALLLGLGAEQRPGGDVFAQLRRSCMFEIIAPADQAQLGFQSVESATAPLSVWLV
jgi:hypothetical protein